MFFGASCYDCSHRAFVSFAKLIEAGYGDMPYDRAKAALKCSKCGRKKLAVTLHGVGVKSLEA
jgi:DNA-directed RNA polymerase subunit RPC12/RpoP